MELRDGEGFQGCWSHGCREATCADVDDEADGEVEIEAPQKDEDRIAGPGRSWRAHEECQCCRGGWSTDHGENREEHGHLDECLLVHEH